MSSIFHRRPTAQPRNTQQAYNQQHYQSFQSPPAAQTAQMAQVETPSLGSARAMSDLRHQGQEAARLLRTPYRALLIEVAISTLDGTYEPYLPPSMEIAQLAAHLAHPSIGLLLANSTGYLTSYSLTPLGGAVVRVLLQEMLAYQRHHAQQPVTAPLGLPWTGGSYE